MRYRRAGRRGHFQPSEWNYQDLLAHTSTGQKYAYVDLKANGGQLIRFTLCVFETSHVSSR